jgi:hypothetical protein
MICADREGKHYEVLSWDASVSGYRLIDSFEWQGSGKGEGLRRLLRHIGDRVEMLAAYGDGFAEGQGDRGLFEAPEIPLIVNVGTPVSRSLAKYKNLVNPAHPSRHGPEATLRDFEFVTELLQENPAPFVAGKPPMDRGIHTWTPDAGTLITIPSDTRLMIRVAHPGFLWTGRHTGSGWENIIMMPLLPDGAGYSCSVPDNNNRFQIFASDKPERPGRWDHREWSILRTPGPTGATWNPDPAKLAMAWKSTFISYAAALILAAGGHAVGIPWLATTGWYLAALLYWGGHSVRHPAALRDLDVIDLTIQKFFAIGVVGHLATLAGWPLELIILMTFTNALLISRKHWEINDRLARDRQAAA